MLEYTNTGAGARLCSFCTTTPNAYGPNQGMPKTKVSTFIQALYDRAKK
jgi:hypothetical protein